ncbi:MAG: 3'-5' exoribonuclease [Butyrivibrio sp.]|nr:3'-5' exoribonuclease [Butyrivibrio sp.]
MTGLLLAIFLGWAGGYRFYKKQPVAGVIYLLTFGICGVGWLIDVIFAIVEFSKQNSNTGHNVYIASTKDVQPYPRNYVAPLTETRAVTDGPEFETHSTKDTPKNIKQLNERFIVVDTETTGLNPNYDRILSIAAILYENGEPTKTFYTLINQPVTIPAEATAINGITNSMIKDAPSEKSAMEAFREFAGDAIQGKTLFVAYNAPFDFKFIKNAMERCGFEGNVRYFDALSYARRNISELKNYKQVTVAKHLRISTENAHNALADCKMCGAILMTLLQRT